MSALQFPSPEMLDASRAGVTGRAVFLSYASQDVSAAERICHALRAAGIEVWFDRSELHGGDEWDARIRRQIRDCAVFVPLISAHTQRRFEGYFRREWRLAAERLRDMADGVTFVLPAALDGTGKWGALVPELFLDLPWASLPDGMVPAKFMRRLHALLDAGPCVAAIRSTVLRRGARKAGMAAVLLGAALALAGVGRHPDSCTEPPTASERRSAPSAAANVDWPSVPEVSNPSGSINLVSKPTHLPSADPGHIAARVAVMAAPESPKTNLAEVSPDDRVAPENVKL